MDDPPDIFRGTGGRSPLQNFVRAHLPGFLEEFEDEHRRRLRTSNSVERLNKEIRRRTRVAGLFPNEPSLLRIITVLAMDVSEDWEAGRIYLSMEDRS